MLGEPYIPEKITVHLGPPDSDAPNVTVDFPTYVKNVASSEIFPTWPEAALRANIYAIISFALNRIYTEWYRSKGYDFDITNSTQYDQKYIHGRDFFENISILVDKIFNSYVRKRGSVEPLFTAFCDGHYTQCEGLKQWGTVDLADKGYIPYEILKHYYGDDIDIVTNVPVKINAPSFPGVPLKIGDSGNDVKTIQVELNRIGANYPAIPKIPKLTGVFDITVEDAVKEFQKIFSIPVTGIVDSATWYKIAYIYASVKKLSELESEGITVEETQKPFLETLKLGMRAPEVHSLQYYLSVLAAYYDALPPFNNVTFYFDEKTEQAVKDFQKLFGLPVTGVVDEKTWDTILSAYKGIVASVPTNLTGIVALYPGEFLAEGMTSDYVRLLQEYLTLISKYYPEIPPVANTGYFGPLTKKSVLAFQKFFGTTQPGYEGYVGTVTWDKIASVYSDLKFGADKRAQQFPGYIIK